MTRSYALPVAAVALWLAVAGRRVETTAPLPEPIPTDGPNQVVIFVP